MNFNEITSITLFPFLEIQITAKNRVLLTYVHIDIFDKENTKKDVSSKKIIVEVNSAFLSLNNDSGAVNGLKMGH